MSLFSRRTILCLPVALAACGFTPVYAPGGNGDRLRGQVTVQPPTDRDSFLLVQDLEQRLGRVDAARFDLKYAISVWQQGQAVSAAGDITRYSLIGRAEYTLHESATGAVVASGAVDHFTGYSATGSTVETLASERDARARMMTILADQITTRLYATADLPA